MTPDQLNQYIDFDTMLSDLLKKHIDDLRQYQFEARHYYTIVEYYDSPHRDKFSVSKSESELDYPRIMFVLDPKEEHTSDPDISETFYVITYDMLLEEFISAECE